jgi:hypothetical protein
MVSQRPRAALTSGVKLDLRAGLSWRFALCPGALCLGVLCLGALCLGALCLGVLCQGALSLGALSLGVLCLGHRTCRLSPVGDVRRRLHPGCRDRVHPVRFDVCGFGARWFDVGGVGLGRSGQGSVGRRRSD